MSASRTGTNKPVRFVTAASLFDGHDVAINIMRRILQSEGAEVIHLGHNRSVDDVVTAALQEDVQGVAISSYQGGHMEYFKYLVDLLGAHGRGDIGVFGGGGGVIVQSEIDELHAYGVGRIYSPEDGRELGLKGMIRDMIARASDGRDSRAKTVSVSDLLGGVVPLAMYLSEIEDGTADTTIIEQIRGLTASSPQVPCLGITGTGGAGKSSLTDEIILRFRENLPDVRIAVLAIDPTRRRTGGALLGDRIRMNSIFRAGDELDRPRVFFRSLATRGSTDEVPNIVPDIIAAFKIAKYDLIIIETPGIGQGDAGIVPHVDVSMYVMTPEFGSASQLEKIDMLDFADLVVVNKFDRKGALDALRDVRTQIRRNRETFDVVLEDQPVYPTVASRFADPGVTALYHAIIRIFTERKLATWSGDVPKVPAPDLLTSQSIVPSSRVRYLAEIAETVRRYRRDVLREARIARDRGRLQSVRDMLAGRGLKTDDMDELLAQEEQDPRAAKLLSNWPKTRAEYSGDELVTKVRDRVITSPLRRKSLSGTSIPKVSLPKFSDDGDLLRWLLEENVPGAFPYTAGVFPFKRDSEDPTRMFAGEGDPARTNRRFHFLSRHSKAKRLSVAFDSPTLYGFDPDERPDIYGKIGNSGVSIATLDDMKVLFDGFDLCDPATSVSMTINGPAPTILAMFLNTAIDQQIDRFEAENGRRPGADESARIKADVLTKVRGTVQADILKEDQGQNTCIFSTQFALGLMADIQDYFIRHDVRNFYSVSISGYHIAEAGANPITQLAFTLANGFTFVEAYRARGMDVDAFAPNLSFFFSNGMDPEYAVIGRVARRIWAVAMRFLYGGGERSQKLKYHIQTSGRSLHAREMAFNDIRTTLQALIAVYDHCNSLHTNAADEAFTTPTEASVRRALAIQQIIYREWGMAMNENPNQGAFIIDELTDLVESAVLDEFDRISERGGVLGAMETGYQRGRIQDESMHYELLKHDGTLPIVGVNTFIDPDQQTVVATPDIQRSTDEEKRSQMARLADFHGRHVGDVDGARQRLKEAVANGENVFEVLMSVVRVCSLGQITRALFEVGGEYRRNM